MWTQSSYTNIQLLQSKIEWHNITVNIALKTTNSKHYITYQTKELFDYDNYSFARINWLLKLDRKKWRLKTVDSSIDNFDGQYSFMSSYTIVGLHCYYLVNSVGRQLGVCTQRNNLSGCIETDSLQYWWNVQMRWTL